MGKVEKLPLSFETETILHQIEIERAREVERKLRRRQDRARVVTAVALIVAGLSMLFRRN